MPGPAFNFNPCHGLSTFLVELVVFDIGKVEISQYFRATDFPLSYWN